MARKRSYRNKKWIYWGAGISAGLFTLYIIYLWSQVRDVKFVEYKEFGISIPQNYSIHGIDVSRYQQNISWKAVRHMQVQDIHLGFAFIKATEGIKNIDPFFKRNWKKAKEAGMIRGAYHFFIASKDGKEQANHFFKMVKLESGDLPPVLDVEESYGMPAARLQKEVKKWLDAMEAAYGVKPIIYTYVTFYDKYLKPAFDEYPLWIAHYFQPQKPRIHRSWHFWQHSDGGRVNGIISKVDFNVFAGDSAAFRALLVP